ncbi:MAG: hypothetical protein HC779_06850 [Phyllobacteriaceae bacterium]|nr:hypothetical protein [Phyllobacteriaceae bacterium]
MGDSPAQHVHEGMQKTAALLLAMGRPLAQRMVSKLSEDELKLISRTARALPPLNRTVVDALVEDFARHFVDQVASAEPEQEIRDILGRSGEDDATGGADSASVLAPENFWPRIMAMPPARVVGVLGMEHPATISVALSAFARQRPPNVDAV